MIALAPLAILATIAATKSLAVLDSLARDIWTEWADGRLSDDQAENIAAAIERRKKEVRGLDIIAARAPTVATAAKARGLPSHFPPKHKRPLSIDRRASRERRRLLAASGPMPPTLACRFTTGELAALRIVADAVRDRGDCRLYIAEIAARAGVGETTTRNALRLAAREGLITIEERRRDKRPNLSNVVRIISREWKLWIERGRRSSRCLRASDAVEGGGFKKAKSTDKASYRSTYGDRGNRDHLYLRPEAPPPTRRHRDIVENGAAALPTSLHPTATPGASA
jgi:hypothetical protein